MISIRTCWRRRWIRGGYRRNILLRESSLYRLVHVEWDRKKAYARDWYSYRWCHACHRKNKISVWKIFLPKNFARPELDKRRLGDVVDLFTNIQMIEHGSEKDILGRTYGIAFLCLLNKKANGRQFFTPSCVVRTFGRSIETFQGPGVCWPLLWLRRYVCSVYKICWESQW